MFYKNFKSKEKKIANKAKSEQKDRANLNFD